MSDKAVGRKTRGPEGCDENGPAAALLLGHVSIQICSLLPPVRLGPPCRRPILIATPLYQSRTWCTCPVGTVDQGLLQTCRSPFLGLGGIAKQNGIHPSVPVSRSTIPPGRVHFSLVSRHFVPGYFRLVPPGQAALFRCRIFPRSILRPEGIFAPFCPVPKMQIYLAGGRSRGSQRGEEFRNSLFLTAPEF